MFRRVKFKLRIRSNEREGGGSKRFLGRGNSVCGREVGKGKYEWNEVG